MNTFQPLDEHSEITRRQWLLRLGEMAVLAGVSGLVPEAVLSQVQSENATLPPGLYVPSADDLVHALSSSHQSLTPPVGSETDYAQPASPFQPQFFSPEEFRVITRIVEIILGAVEPDALNQTTQWIDLWFHSSSRVREAARRLDPLHRALAVGYFGENTVRELETTDPAAIARDGIAVCRKLSVDRYGRGFLDLDADEQTELVRSIGSAAAGEVSRKFWEILRGEAIRGYYTSPAGLKELNYKGNAYYADCPGCGLSNE